ncbi:MAG: hypothetical protein QOH95_2851, partial [Gaiellaceae bacterium]|nr:hypothetical protein [Gaiellaceae bacterium]
GVFWQPGTSTGRTACAELWVAPAEVVSPNPVALDTPAGVRLTIENHGNEPATNVVVRISAATPDVTIGPCAGCDIATLAPGATATVAYNVSSKKAGVPNVTVTVDATEPSPAPELASAGQFVQVLPCTIAGTAGADRLVGTPRADRICGLPGADYLTGGAGNDTIDGGSGNDTIFGGPGRDRVDARDGRDVVFARDGSPDTIDCGAQYDVAVVDRFDRTSHCERVLRH